MGGQAALNCALTCARRCAEKIWCRVDWCQPRCHRQGRGPGALRPRDEVRGLETPRSAIAHSLKALKLQSQLGFPCVIRPSFTMGGSGGGIAYNREEFVEICNRGLELSPTSSY